MQDRRSREHGLPIKGRARRIPTTGRKKKQKVRPRRGRTESEREKRRTHLEGTTSNG